MTMTDENLIARPTETPPARVTAHTITDGDLQLSFRSATLPELDRYLSSANGKLVTSSVRLATDMAHDPQAAAQAFEIKPGLAVQVANMELAAKGFSAPKQD